MKPTNQKLNYKTSQSIRLTSKLFRGALSMLCAVLCLTSSGSILAREIQLDSEPYIKLGTPAISRTKLNSDGAKLFEVRFNNESFTGDLIGRDVDQFGSVSEDTFDSSGLISVDRSLWRASRSLRLVAPSTRNIFTSEANGTATSFLWPSLSTSAKMMVDPDGNTNAANNDILDWIRGDSAHEGTKYRDRSVTWIGGTEFHNKMGSIVNSSPAYVGPPTEFFSDNNYSAFRQAKRNRVPMVYVGANDGMLHAFEAGNANATGSTPGREVFAYVPYSVLDSIKDHTLPDIDVQNYSVDGSPVTQDAYGPFPKCGGGSCWRTILVSGVRGGGRGVFALDVTDPVSDATSVAAAKSLLVWEFKALDTDGDGDIDLSDSGGNADLGYTYSQPIISKLSDGTWVAIFGNGYNSTGSGNPSLYVVELATGNLIKRIEASRASPWRDLLPNGLSSVAGWDADFDGGVDYVYAGDLDGNMWKFLLTGATKSSTAAMKVAFSGAPLLQIVNSDPDPDGFTLFIPITGTPVVAVHPEGGQMVYFGNGIALDASHESVVGDRGVFAIRDDKPSGDTYNPPYGIYPAAPFTLTTHTTGNGGTGNVLRGIKSTVESSHNVGWVLELPEREQAITDLSVSSRRLNVMSVESIVDVNNFNWLHTLDYLTGGAPESPVFDANLDDDIDADDVISIAGGPSNVVPIGGAVGKAVASAPRIVTSSNGNDVFILTLAIEVRNEFNNPFVDPGLSGGHIDVDEYYNPVKLLTLGNIPGSTSSVKDTNLSSVAKKGGKGGKGKDDSEEMYDEGKHTHEYDDDNATNGVQMLVNNPSSAEPSVDPHVETAVGMGGGYEGLLDGTLDGVFEDSNGNEISQNDSVTIHITNPYSVDTQTWANERYAKGISDNKIAEPANFYFGCSALPVDKNYRSIAAGAVAGGDAGGISAPDFAALPAEDRTCPIKFLTELRVRFNDINSVRAAEPGCNKDKNVAGPVLPPTALLAPGGGQNTAYRNGSFVVSATLPSGELFWDVTIYEHLKDVNPPKGRKIECGEVNEDMRAYRELPDGDLGNKDPDPGGAGGGADPSDVEFPGQGGFQGFIGTPSITLDPYTGRSDDTTDFLSTRPASKRVNWREAKD